MLAVYTLSILLSALLLFLVQPMAAKMVLPALGGSPAVWITCMVFFQAMLLAGYLYAHLLTRWFGARTQLLAHALLVAITLPLLPIGSAASPAPPEGAAPTLWLLQWLALSIGGPFFVLSTTTPLFQRWFSSTEHREARDPYFLYVASNLGSMTGLLAYPLVLEPVLRMRSPGFSLLPPSQTLLWTLGYAGFAACAVACGVLMLVRRNPRSLSEVTADPGVRPALGRRLLWILLALVPCSAMLGATQMITSEIAAVPLLWIVPLALYLLTFILAFGRRRWIPHRWSSVALAVLVAAVVATLVAPGRPSAWLLVPLHLLTVFAAGVVCHGRLARDRPSADRLTEFYLLIALGGVLGGAFNGLVAPVVFDSILEYPIALLAACLLRPRASGRETASSGRGLTLNWLLPIGVGLLALFLNSFFGTVTAAGGWPMALVVGGPPLVCLLTLHRPLRFGLCLAAVFAVGSLLPRLNDPPLHTARTFFGIHAVQNTEGPPFDAIDPRTGARTVIRIPFRQLVHGTTRHGSQAQIEQLRSTPTTYYHRSGPIGQVFDALKAAGRSDRVALVGLGVGTLAVYAGPGSHFTFFEIDEEVVAIARDPEFFTYLADSAGRVDTVVGDGRMSLTREPDGALDLIVVDAFSSDSVPVHLLTREAIELYLSKLRPGGLLAFHQTSQYLDLTRVVDAIASDLGLTGITQTDGVTSLSQLTEGKDSSVWSVLGRDVESLGILAADSRWEPLPREPGRRPERRYLWTDDFSNVLSVLRLTAATPPTAESTSSQ